MNKKNKKLGTRIGIGLFLLVIVLFGLYYTGVFSTIGSEFTNIQCVDVTPFKLQGYVTSSFDERGCEIVQKKLLLSTFSGGYNTVACPKPGSRNYRSGDMRASICGGSGQISSSTDNLGFADCDSHCRSGSRYSSCLLCGVYNIDYKGGSTLLDNECVFEEGDVLNAQSYSSGEIIDVENLDYPSKGFCRAIPAIIRDTTDNIAITDTSIYEKLVETEPYIVQSNTDVTIFYVVEGSLLSSQTLQEKINIISQLEVDSVELGKIIDKLTSNKEEQLAIIKALNLKAVEQGIIIGQLDLTVQQQGDYILELSEKAENQKIMIQALTSNIDRQLEIIEVSETDLDEKTKLVGLLNLEIARQVEAINTISANLAEKIRMVELLSAENVKQAEAIEEFKDLFQEQADIMNGLDLTIKDDAIVIKGLTDSLAEEGLLVSALKRTIDEDVALIKELTAEVDEQAIILKNLKRNAEDMAKIINKLDLSNEKLRSLVVELEYNSEELTKLLSELSLSNELTIQLLEDARLNVENSLDEINKLKSQNKNQNTLLQILFGIIIIGLVGTIIFYGRKLIFKK